MNVTITQTVRKPGVIMIPKEVRRMYKIHPGDIVVLQFKEIRRAHLLDENLPEVKKNE